MAIIEGMALCTKVLLHLFQHPSGWWMTCHIGVTRAHRGTDHACVQSRTKTHKVCNDAFRLPKHLPSLVLPDAAYSQLHGEVLPCAAADATHQRLQETGRQQLEALASYLERHLTLEQAHSD